MSCANTSLPWFIDPPRAMLPRGVAKPKFEIQIETKKINRLCVFHQQLTGAESPNVGTLLISHLRLCHAGSTRCHSRWEPRGRLACAGRAGLSTISRCLGAPVLFAAPPPCCA